MPNLTGNTALDVAIGLAFVYLLFSILCSAVQEAIAGMLDLRARTLEQGLVNMLDDPGSGPTCSGSGRARVAVPPPPAPGAGGATPSGLAAERGSDVPTLTNELLGHGLIRTQYRGSRVPGLSRRGPSYISSQTFALALFDIVSQSRTTADQPAPVPVGGPAGGDTVAPLNLSAAIAQTNVAAGTEHALLALARSAGGDREKFRSLLERWFDSSMDRVSGWYKRRTQVIVCFLALLVTLACNVNTISIADRLVNDDAVRAAVVSQATTTSAKAGDSLDTVASNITNVQQLGLPLGWDKKAGDPAKPDLDNHLWRTLGGWLLTFLALSLGAPFWFDALSKIAGLRNTGTKPGTPTA
ncbi:MAG TPA: hypothetical protein VHZ31_00470 [Solirubrobacteraceae bacterium]|jgi:hypothetical protein|nr:hypothetical protein [Solirubrobacteraceae bacterium]